MSFSYYKYLFYINNEGFTTVCDLQSAFHLNDEDIQDILNTLIKNGYVRVFKDFMYFRTYKGKHFIPSAICKWLYDNFLAIIAIIISIVALFK